MRPVRIPTLLTALLTLAAVFLAAPAPSRASEVRPSVEITGSEDAGICDNSSGSLNPQIPVLINRDVDSSTLGQLFVLGAWIVASELETDPFGNPTFEGAFGFVPSLYNVPPGTRFTARMTTYYGPAGTGGVSYVGEVVFDCATGEILSLVNLEALYFDGFESGGLAFWSSVVDGVPDA